MENDQELQEEMGLVVPETALMTDIDKTAADLGLAAPLTSEVPMGVDPGQAAAPAPIDPSLRLDTEYANAVDVFDPFNSSIVEQVKNMTGAQYPTDPITGTPLPAGPLPDMSAAQGPAVLAPEQQLMTQKVGDQTSTQMLPTQGTDASLGMARGAVSAADAAAAEAVQITKTLAEDKAKIDQARALSADDFSVKAQALYAQAERDMQINKDEIARLRQEYAAQPWQSYWGSKDTGDKIMLSLAVGLGALGQAHVGGQNLAMAFIQSGIDDHNKSQDQRFRQLESQLNSAQAGSVQAQQAIKTQFDNLVALKASAYDQLDKQLAAISAKTNVESARVGAEKMRADLGLKNAKDLFDMEKELAVRTTKRTDIFDTKTVKGNPLSFVQANGQPMTEAQSKEYKAFVNSAEAIKDMETLEDQGYTNSSQFASVNKALEGEFRDLGALKGPIEGALLLARFDSAVTRASAGDPSTQLYVRAMRKAMVDKLRLDSGASISPSEYYTFKQTYVPSDNTVNIDPGHQKINLEQTRRFRRTYLETMLGASGSPNQPWYKGGNK
jgi:hypothetical protein